MDQLGQQANLNRCRVSLAQMRKQALDLKAKVFQKRKNDPFE